MTENGGARVVLRDVADQVPLRIVEAERVALLARLGLEADEPLGAVGRSPERRPPPHVVGREEGLLGADALEAAIRAHALEGHEPPACACPKRAPDANRRAAEEASTGHGARPPEQRRPPLTGRGGAHDPFDLDAGANRVGARPDDAPEHEGHGDRAPGVRTPRQQASRPHADHRPTTRAAIPTNRNLTRL
ncbi:MAG: hypothetical protein H6716_25190 [Polyangiaceae bacterium]|nr:hypothetical protein [Polyangiaceae bacterium]